MFVWFCCKNTTINNYVLYNSLQLIHLDDHNQIHESLFHYPIHFLVKTSYILNCDHPCTSSKCGRIKQITIHHNYRFNSSMPRDSLKWEKIYKLRTICERANHQFKSLMQLNSSKIRNTTSLKSDVLFAGIAQLTAFIVIFKSSSNASPISTKSLFAS
jgi:hypothetical protein